MAANLEDFVSRLVRGNKKITFIFTEDFFNVFARTGNQVNQFRDIRNAIKNVGHRKGEIAVMRAGGNEEILFDVNVVVVRTNNTCFTTTFKELASGPFGDEAVILGYGSDMVDAQKAKYQIEAFLSEKLDQSMTVTKMIAEYRKRKLVVIAESPADLKRPSMEPIMDLRSMKQTVLISPTKGPLVDCQVARLSDSENSNSFSTLLSMLSVKY